MSTEGPDLASALTQTTLHPHSVSAWTAVLMAAASLSAADAREHYEAALAVFPTSGRIWRDYAEHEARDGNAEVSEAIYARALPQVLDIDLWVSYVDYVSATAAASGGGHSAIVAAFEFALEHMAFDIRAGLLWHKYIGYLANCGEDEGGEALRKAYQRAIAFPVFDIESLWRAYSAFEHGRNVQLARAILEQHKRTYEGSRNGFHGLRNALGPLASSSPLPPLPSPSAESINFVATFRRWIKWEKDNPLSLEPSLLNRRLAFAYNKTLHGLYYYPEMWYEAYSVFHRLGEVDTAAAFLARGTRALPSNELLSFAYAAHCQSLGTEGGYADARDTYEALIEATGSPLAYIQYMRFAWRCVSAAAGRAIFKRARAAGADSHQVYLAAALNEFYFGKDLGIAQRVFEAGMEDHAGNVDYVMGYLDYLGHLNNESATRPVFERALASVTPEDANELWSAYIAFEVRMGDVGVVNTLLTRRLAALNLDDDAAAAAAEPGAVDPGTSTTMLDAASLYRFMDLYPLSPGDAAVVTANEKARVESSVGSGKGGKGAMKGSMAGGRGRAAERSKPRPTTSALVSFNPSGGDTSRMPVWLQDLAHALPLASGFSAPLVNVPFLVSVLEGLDAVEPAPPNTAVVPGRVAGASSSSVDTDAVKKRKRGAGVGVGAPALETATESDVFRARQLKKLKNK